MLIPAYQLRITQLQAQIRPLARGLRQVGCTGRQREQLLEQLIPLYNTLFALQAELDLN